MTENRGYQEPQPSQEPVRPPMTVEDFRRLREDIAHRIQDDEMFQKERSHWFTQFNALSGAVDRGEITRAEADETLAELYADKIVAFQIDPLTELYNYAGFLRRADEYLAIAARESNPASIVIADLDFFKAINDTYGHPAGNAVLQQTAGYMKSESRRSDIIARFGGEEFVMLLPHTSEQNAYRIVERIRVGMPDAVREAVTQMGFSITRPITASFGIAQSGITYDINRLLADADERLYVAKSEGRNRVVDGREIAIIENRKRATPPQKG